MYFFVADLSYYGVELNVDTPFFEKPSKPNSEGKLLPAYRVHESHMFEVTCPPQQVEGRVPHLRLG